MSTFVWAWQAWNPETNYEHAKLIPLIVAFLIWQSRDQLRAAPIGTSRWGWAFIGFGLFLYFAAARTLQARLALTALPFLLFGVVLYLWGRKVARILLFPIAFLLFMVPLNFLAQATSNLQFIETGAATAICNFLGIHVYSLGTTINAANESFHFQIDEGCSGIRSLMAIAMLSAIYGHLTQDRLLEEAPHLLRGDRFRDHRQRRAARFDHGDRASCLGRSGWRHLPCDLRLSFIPVRDRRDAAFGN